MSFRLLERIFSAFGLPHPQQDDPVREDDLAVVSQLSILFTAVSGEARFFAPPGSGARASAESPSIGFTRFTS